jgi:Flp pilus assembly pilin Flp
MTRLRIACDKYWSDEQGASIVEYALLLVLITIACYAATAAFGAQIGNFFTSVSSSL